MIFLYFKKASIISMIMNTMISVGLVISDFYLKERTEIYRLKLDIFCSLKKPRNSAILHSKKESRIQKNIQGLKKKKHYQRFQN